MITFFGAFNCITMKVALELWLFSLLQFLELSQWATSQLRNYEWLDLVQMEAIFLWHHTLVADDVTLLFFLGCNSYKPVSRFPQSLSFSVLSIRKHWLITTCKIPYVWKVSIGRRVHESRHQPPSVMMLAVAVGVIFVLLCFSSSVPTSFLPHLLLPRVCLCSWAWPLVPDAPANHHIITSVY